jgi:hypothetical protein
MCDEKKVADPFSSQHILHLFSSPSIQYLFSLYFLPHLNLAIIFFSFALFLFPGTPEFPLSLFFPFFLTSLCLYPFHSAIYPPIFLLLLIFPLLHWHTRFFDSISLSPSSPCFFLSLQHSISILHSSLPSILCSNFPAFTLSLFLLHSSLTM